MYWNGFLPSIRRINIRNLSLKVCTSDVNINTTPPHLIRQIWIKKELNAWKIDHVVSLISETVCFWFVKSNWNCDVLSLNRGNSGLTHRSIFLINTQRAQCGKASVWTRHEIKTLYTVMLFLYFSFLPYVILLSAVWYVFFIHFQSNILNKFLKKTLRERVKTDLSESREVCRFGTDKKCKEQKGEPDQIRSEEETASCFHSAPLGSVSQYTTIWGCLTLFLCHCTCSVNLFLTR